MLKTVGVIAKHRGKEMKEECMDLKLITKETKREFNIDFLNEAKAKEIYDYHRSFDAYEKTPLADLKHLAKYWGVKNIFVKDESYRFGLNAFKVLGGSYALGKVIAEKLGIELSELPYKRLISDEIREKLGEVTFVTATDGNHGRGVAWTARELKQKAIVFMPKGTVQERVDHITKLGAKVEVTEMNYDDTVRYANDLAEKNGYIMVQDTAWEGYEEIPEWIMQGYMTLAYEITAELNEKNVRPTHVFLQAGVGSFAAAATGYFSNVYRDNKPQIAIVEPDAVACIYESAKEDRRVLIGGEYSTIMAGLSCGEPNITGLKIFMDYAEHYLAASDEFAAHGMRVLGAPMKGDRQVISGESGACTLGVVSKIMTDDRFKDLREELKLDENSSIVFVSTEGDTDRQNYLDVVWDGKYSSI